MRRETLRTRAETRVSTRSLVWEKRSVKCCKQVNQAGRAPAAAAARPPCLLISAVAPFRPARRPGDRVSPSETPTLTQSRRRGTLTGHYPGGHQRGATPESTRPPSHAFGRHSGYPRDPRIHNPRPPTAISARRTTTQPHATAQDQQHLHPDQEDA